MASPPPSVLVLPGWLFPPETLDPLRSACRAHARWTTLPWEAALDMDPLRAAVASLPSPCWIAAWSLGAMAALRLASGHPANLAGLLLFGATARLPEDAATAHAGVAPSVLAAMRKRLRRDPAGLFREFHALCHRPGTPPDGDADAFVARAMARDPEAADAGLALLASLDLRASLAAVDVPVFALHGEADAVVPVSQARTLGAALPRGRVLTLPRRGHVPDADLFAVAGDLLTAQLELPHARRESAP